MLHREGTKTIFVSLLILAVPYVALTQLGAADWAVSAYLVVALILLSLVLQFFRNPTRRTVAQVGDVIAPADGTVVVIEEAEEPEYFQGKRKQVSIFMSPLNVHVNRAPVSGRTVFAKYHKGKYLVAWHPKSSTENERTTLVFETLNHGEVMIRQIAGAVARRIAVYVKPGQPVSVGEDVGFIRFGSRVDIFLPLDAEILCQIGDKPRGGETVIAKLHAVS
ncbi:MAG: phosphatidylserine decarboxylase family protein [Schleiferiaceae bacterium]|jgi:phosphatidylserine decarboxylase